jgi:cytochrome c
MPRFCIALGLIAILFCAWNIGPIAQVAARDDAATPEFYATRVKPIFDANCARCHLNGNHRGGLNMDTRDAMLKGGRDGSVLVPGDPSKSLLVQLIRHEGPADDPMPMPPGRPKISDADIAVVTQWVQAGAVMPAH